MVVIAGQDYQAVVEDAETVLLRLVSADEQVHPELLGEAVQAFAALPSSRALIETGRLPELRDLLRNTLRGYLRAN